MREYSTISGEYVIRVDKIGGGTVGHAYTGDWEVTILRNDTVLMDDTLTTGYPSTHRTVADLALEFLEDEEV
jgi:hypothetical protein